MANDLGKCDVVTWGEAFLRLTPKEKERFEQSAGFNVAIAGGALETAVGLSRLGYRALWFSAVGDTPLGAKIVNKVREHGVDTTCVELVPDGRTGLCYTEIGTAPRLTKSWFDMLYEEGDTHPKMMSVGLHCRIIGKPGRAYGLKKFLEYASSKQDVWFARRLDIARWWLDHYPPQ